MKSMKARELQDLKDSSPQDLEVKLNDLKRRLFNLRFQLATGQLENPMRIREVKSLWPRLRPSLDKRTKEFGTVIA